MPKLLVNILYQLFIIPLHIHISYMSVWVSACLFATYKRQNGSTNQVPVFSGHFNGRSMDAQNCKILPEKKIFFYPLMERKKISEICVSSRVR